MCYFCSLFFTQFNDIYIANLFVVCVSCNFLLLHMRFCNWPLKLHDVFAAQRHNCLTHMRCCHWPFLYYILWVFAFDLIWPHLTWTYIWGFSRPATIIKKRNSIVFYPINYTHTYTVHTLSKMQNSWFFYWSWGLITPLLFSVLYVTNNKSHVK